MDYRIASFWRFPMKYYKSLTTHSTDMKNKQPQIQSRSSPPIGLSGTSKGALINVVANKFNSHFSSLFFFFFSLWKPPVVFNIQWDQERVLCYFIFFLSDYTVTV